MKSFWEGFEKQASQNEPNKHHVRRAILGNSISSAIEAKKGKKTEAFGEAFKHDLKSRVKGTLSGAAMGAAGGAAAGLSSRVGGSIRGGAVLGGLAGASLGNAVGMFRGTHGAKASEIHARNSKHKKD